jgi:hypothetical protein
MYWNGFDHAHYRDYDDADDDDEHGTGPVVTYFTHPGSKCIGSLVPSPRVATKVSTGMYGSLLFEKENDDNSQQRIWTFTK